MSNIKAIKSARKTNRKKIKRKNKERIRYYTQNEYIKYNIPSGIYNMSFKAKHEYVLKKV